MVYTINFFPALLVQLSVINVAGSYPKITTNLVRNMNPSCFWIINLLTLMRLSPLSPYHIVIFPSIWIPMVPDFYGLFHWQVYFSCIWYICSEYRPILCILAIAWMMKLLHFPFMKACYSKLLQTGLNFSSKSKKVIVGCFLFDNLIYSRGLGKSTSVLL